jgi:heat shock protein HtpX
LGVFQWQSLKTTMRKTESLKTWIGLGTLSLLLLLGGHWALGRYGLLLGFLAAVGVNSLVFFYAGWRMQNLFPAELLEGQDAWGILQLTRELTEQIGIPMPEIFLLDISTPTAFSTGTSPNRAALFLSEPLVQDFPQDEIRAVIAHELARIQRFDTLRALAGSVLASGFVFLAAWLDRVFLLRMRRPLSTRLHERFPLFPQNLTAKRGFSIGTPIFAPVILLLVNLTLSRKSRFAADHLAADWIQSPETLARALWKLDSYSATIPLEVPLSDSHLFIVNPLTTHSWCRYFLRQPSVEQRIKKLLGYYPL